MYVGLVYVGFIHTALKRFETVYTKGEFMTLEERVAKLDKRFAHLTKVLICLVVVSVALVSVAARETLANLVAGKVEIKDEKNDFKTTTVLYPNGDVVIPGQLTIGEKEKLKTIFSSNGDVTVDGSLKIQGDDVAAKLKAFDLRLAALEKKTTLHYAFHDETIGTAGIASATWNIPFGPGVPENDTKTIQLPGDAIAAWCDYGRGESLHCLGNFYEISATPKGKAVVITVKAMPNRPCRIIVRTHYLYEK